MDLGKEMKKIMKEAIINFLKNIKTDDKEKINNVINFLERGWKYEEMWEELQGMMKVLNPSMTAFSSKEFYDEMEFIKQKYFPQVDKK